MSSHRVRLTCALAAFAFLGCADGDVATDGPTSGGADPVTARGNSYRSDLKRAAMRGLRYESGEARVDPVEAEEVAPERDPGAVDGELARGGELMARGEGIEAVAAFTKAVLLAPDRAPSYAALAEALITIGKDREALAALRTSLVLDAGVAEVHFRYGEALARLGQREDGVAALRDAIRLDPDLAAAQARLAIQLYYLGDAAAAWGSVHRAEALGKDVPPQFRALLAAKMPEPGTGSGR